MGIWYSVGVGVCVGVGVIVLLALVARTLKGRLSYQTLRSALPWGRTTDMADVTEGASGGDGGSGSDDDEWSL